MNREVFRQLVHLSGLLFVFIAQFLDRWVSAMVFLGIGVFFFIYGEYVKRKEHGLFGLRKLAMMMERKESRLFSGAFWFYIGCGISFLLFHHQIASAASAILAVGDSLSTIVGINFGRHKIIGKKSIEGSLTFFVSSFLISLIFVRWEVGLIGALIASVIELITPHKVGKKTYWILDDNLLIPIISGAVMFGVDFYLFLTVFHLAF